MKEKIKPGAEVPRVLTDERIIEICEQNFGWLAGANDSEIVGFARLIERAAIASQAPAQSSKSAAPAGLEGGELLTPEQRLNIAEAVRRAFSHVTVPHNVYDQIAWNTEQACFVTASQLAAKGSSPATQQGDEPVAKVITGRNGDDNGVRWLCSHDAMPAPGALLYLAATQQAEPVDMVLHCPSCHLQHIDAPDERTPDWKNKPHRSHLCHGCGHIWRPADVPTNGVSAIKTKGKADAAPVSPSPVSASPQAAVEPPGETVAWADESQSKLYWAKGHPISGKAGKVALTYAVEQQDQASDERAVLYAAKRVDGTGYGSWLHHSRESAETHLKHNGPAAPKYKVVEMVERASSASAPKASGATEFDQAELMRLVREFAEVCYGLRRTTEDVGGKLVEYVKSLASPAATEATKQPELTVWYGSMPESNGKSNFTATLMRKGSDFFDTDQYTFSRSEHPDRVRYEADFMSYLIGERAERPEMWDKGYDFEKHSGYKSAATEASGAAVPDADAKDAARLDWLAYYGAALRIDPEDGRWFLDAVQHTKISCVDDHTRFDTPRAAIDAAIAAAPAAPEQTEKPDEK